MLNLWLKILSFFQKDKEITVISKDVTIQGDLLASNLFIDGSILTDTLSAEYIELGSNGEITGNITCKEISINGEVTGNIYSDVIILQKNARINGNISGSNISILSGATISGDITKRNELLIERFSNFEGKVING